MFASGGRAALVVVLATLAPAGAARGASSAYVANQVNSTVSQYDIGAGGPLTPKAPPTVPTGANGSDPFGVVVSPDRASVYVINHGADSIAQYDIGADGGLSPKAPATVADTGSNPNGIAVSPDGTSVYVANGSGAVSQYDVGAGGKLSAKATPIVAEANGPFAIAVSPNGASVYVTNVTTNGAGGVSEYDVGAGGALTPKDTQTVAAGNSPSGIAVSPDGTSVYVANRSGGVSQYNVGGSGALTPKATPIVNAGTGAYGIAVSPDGASVYVTNIGSSGAGGLSQYDVGAGGALTLKASPTVDTGDGPSSVALTPDGTSAYVTNSFVTGAGGVSQYDVGAAGALAPKATPTVSSGGEPIAIAIASGPPPGPPSALISTPPDGATYASGSVVTASYSCAPGANGGVLKPGAAGCSGPVPNGSQIDTSTIGAHAFAVTATDADGRTATTTTHYTGDVGLRRRGPATATTFAPGQPQPAGDRRRTGQPTHLQLLARDVDGGAGHRRPLRQRDDFHLHLAATDPGQQFLRRLPDRHRRDRPGLSPNRRVGVRPRSELADPLRRADIQRCRVGKRGQRSEDAEPGAAADARQQHHRYSRDRDRGDAGGPGRQLQRMRGDAAEPHPGRRQLAGQRELSGRHARRRELHGRACVRNVHAARESGQPGRRHRDTSCLRLQRASDRDAEPRQLACRAQPDADVRERGGAGHPGRLVQLPRPVAGDPAPFAQLPSDSEPGGGTGPDRAVRELQRQHFRPDRRPVRRDRDRPGPPDSAHGRRRPDEHERAAGVRDCSDRASAEGADLPLRRTAAGRRHDDRRRYIRGQRARRRRRADRQRLPDRRVHRRDSRPRRVDLQHPPSVRRDRPGLDRARRPAADERDARDRPRPRARARRHAAASGWDRRLRRQLQQTSR